MHPWVPDLVPAVCRYFPELFSFFEHLTFQRTFVVSGVRDTNRSDVDFFDERNT